MKKFVISLIPRIIAHILFNLSIEQFMQAIYDVLEYVNKHKILSHHARKIMPYLSLYTVTVHKV